MKVYRWNELDGYKPLFSHAYELWEAAGKDEGPVVCGCGLEVDYIPKHCRIPRGRIVVPSPFQGDGAASVHVARDFLASHGIETRYNYGRMD